MILSSSWMSSHPVFLLVSVKISFCNIFNLKESFLRIIIRKFNIFSLNVPMNNYFFCFKNKCNKNNYYTNMNCIFNCLVKIFLTQIHEISPHQPLLRTSQQEQQQRQAVSLLQLYHLAVQWQGADSLKSSLSFFSSLSNSFWWNCKIFLSYT